MNSVPVSIAFAAMRKKISGDGFALGRELSANRPI